MIFGKRTDSAAKTSRTEQAYTWLACLESGDMTPEEFEAFIAWRDSSSDNARVFSCLQRSWDSVKSIPVEKPVPDLSLPDNGGGRSFFTRLGLMLPRWQLLTAVCLVVASLFVIGYLNQQNAGVRDTVESHYATGRAEQLSINLEDGSILHMNALSKVQVSFSNRHRDIFVRQGEVLFEVARNPQRPFTVIVDENRIHAIGTQFNVDVRRSNQVTVTLIEGAIRVVKHLTGGEDLSRILEKPGQQARLRHQVSASGSLAPLEIVDGNENLIAETLAWREGRLIFRGERLDDALDEINRHTQHTIVLKDIKLATTPVFAVFDSGDWRGALSAMTRNFPLEAVQISPRETHLVAASSEHKKREPGTKAPATTEK